MKETGNLIVDKTFKFALEIAEYTNSLEQLKKFPLANQLFKSGTSIGANVREAQRPESRNDFIHKLRVSLKEAEETDYWLDICESAECIPSPPANMRKELESIIKILSKIISSSLRNRD